MKESKSNRPVAPLRFSNSDPLGINNISLGGAPPSLKVEAQIAARQYYAKNGSAKKTKVDDQSKKKD